MNPTTPSQTAKQEFTDILLSVNFDTEEQVKKKETGLKIAQRIYASQSSNTTDLNFFARRSEKWKELVKWATGKQSNKEFLQYLNVVDATKSYLNIDMSPIMVGSQFVSTLVTSMSKNEEYACVTATDDGSMTEKEERKMDAYFRMHNAREINVAEEEAGMLFEQPDAHVPEDELSAEVFFKSEDRLPKEIKYEQKIEANALGKSKFQRLLKPKLYFDATVNNFICTKIDSDGNGGYKVRRCVPANMVYSYFQGDSSEGEAGYIGEVYSLKVKDIRSKFPSVTEKELFDFAKFATTQNVGGNFNFEWKNEFMDYTSERAWDEMSIPVFDFEIEINVNDYFVRREDNFGKENITPKKNKPQPTGERAKAVAKQKTRWYRGVYAIFGQKMIYWGLPDLVIFPFMNWTKGMSSYTINIPMNTGEYTPSLFERALEPLKEYALTKLKRKQLISKLRPSGIRIDIESARNITLGNGQTIAWEEILRVFDQTGTELYSSRGVNPNEREGPAISNTAADDTINKILELTNLLEQLIVEIRGLLGVPMYRDGSDVGDRTSGVLQEQQLTASFNVTDHIPNGFNQLWEETLYKCCILEWQKAIKDGETDISSTEFELSVKMKPTEYQQKVLEQRIMQWSATPDAYGNPLLSPKDVYFIENIKDHKLAMWYLANVVETNRRKAMEEKAALDKQNQENQIASAQAAGQEALKQEEAKYQREMDKMSAQSKGKQKEDIISGVFKLISTGMPIPDGMQPLVRLILENHAIPLMQENNNMVQQAQQEEIQEQQAAAMEDQIMQISQQTGMSPEDVMMQMQAQQQQPQA